MKTLNLALCLASLGLATASQAVVIFSFEGGTDGFVNPAWSVGDTALSQNSFGATDGSQSLKVQRPGASNGFRWIVADGVSTEVKQNLKNSTHLLVDVTIGTDFGASSWFKMSLVLNQAAWNQTPELLISPTTPGTHTLDFDISALAPNIVVNDWMRFGFSINSDGPSATTTYLDNFRAVPEPASLAIFGLGLAALKLRRKR
ncbi:MAG: PEP-CTERM sorting domain-containing protein [Fimbriimonadaceae bacterium]|nr:PEP-CTERM sorting domain-containing protein [Fimbriimonadaceae bacterium]